MKRTPKTGCPGTAFCRTTGPNRHVTIYPLLNGSSTNEKMTPNADFGTAEADVLVKVAAWRRDGKWTQTEPGVYVCKVVKE